MKKILTFLSVIGLLFAFSSASLASSSVPSSAIAADVAAQHQMPGNLSMDELLTLKPKEISKRTGQKMNFFERMAFRMVQKKVKKKIAKSKKSDQASEASGLGIASLVMGSLSILGALLMFFVPGMLLLALVTGLAGTIMGAIARSDGDRSGATTAGFIMSLVGGGLALLLLILAIAVLASFF